jgi:hypothetical protein
MGVWSASRPGRFTPRKRALAIDNNNNNNNNNNTIKKKPVIL